jgi:hypothetical protein
LGRESLRDRLIQPVDDRDHGNDRSDTHDDADEGQRRAKFILPKTAESDEERFPNRRDANNAERASAG